MSEDKAFPHDWQCQMSFAYWLCLALSLLALPVLQHAFKASSKFTALSCHFVVFNEANASVIPSYNGRLHPVKNIILLIGDGMGLSYIRLTQLAYGELALGRFVDIGIVYTDSLSGEVTDSALATGFKMKNGMLLVIPTSHGLINVMMILELA